MVARANRATARQDGGGSGDREDHWVRCAREAEGNLQPEDEHDERCWRPTSRDREPPVRAGDELRMSLGCRRDQAIGCGQEGAVGWREWGLAMTMAMISVPKVDGSTVDLLDFGWRRTDIPRDPEKWVFLRPHPKRWKRLPGGVRPGLRGKQSEILAMRASIAAAAKVPVMPPVEIVDAAWVLPDSKDVCLGAVGNLWMEGYLQFGVVLPGASILGMDSLTLRQVLLRGFNQCFGCQREMLRHADSTGVLLENPWPDAPNAKGRALPPCNEDPKDWFGEADAGIYASQPGDFLHQGALNLAVEIARHWVVRGLPAEPMPGYMEGPIIGYVFGIDDATIAHIRMLESRATRRRKRVSRPVARTDRLLKRA